MLNRIATTAALLTAVATSTSAAGFRAENRVMVQGDGADIRVSSGGGFGARGMWCAAADYARDVLGASGTSRLYVVQPSARGQRTVVFSLTPQGTTPQPVLLTGGSVRTAGANLSVDHAQQFCADAKLINR